MKLYEVLKGCIEENKRIRRTDWPEEDCVRTHDQGEDEIPNKDMLVKWITNQKRSYAWTPDQIDLFVNNWEYME